MTITKENITIKPYYKDLCQLFKEFCNESLTSAMIEQIMVKGNDINNLIYDNNQSQLNLWSRTTEFFKNSKNREKLKKLIDDGRINPNSISSKRQMLKFLDKMIDYEIRFIRKKRSGKYPEYELNKIFFIDFIKEFSQVSRDVLDDEESEHFAYKKGNFKEIEVSNFLKMKGLNVLLSIFGGTNIIKTPKAELRINKELKSIIGKLEEEHHLRMEEKFPLTSSNPNIRAYDLAQRHLTPLVLQIIIY